MWKKLLLPLVLASWPSYSYSESIAPYYGYTGNAITDQSLRWSMPNVLPSPDGLFVDNVIYSYQIEKETGEWVTVTVANANADGTGYIFREVDEWYPGSLGGQQINKIVPLGRLHRSLFGDGSITVEGEGQVVNARLVYTYMVDPCYDPQFDPNCLGYEEPVYDIPPIVYDDYDATLNGDGDRRDYEGDDEKYEDDPELTDEEKAELENEEEKDRKDRLEKALSAAGTSQLFAMALAKSQIIDTMNLAVNMTSYYQRGIPGGSYNETVDLVDTDLPDNASGLRNGFAQQLLHEQMIESQYD
jgi:hypothetical protein